MSLRKHYRKVPRQLSDEELLSLTTKVLKKCGVENQTQAQFTYEICLEILQRANINSNFQLRSQISSQNYSRSFQKSRSPKSQISAKQETVNPFYSLQPRPKIRRNSIAWNQAYSIIISYLTQFNMHTTLATVEAEFKNTSDKSVSNTRPSRSLFFTNFDENDNDNELFECDTTFMENLSASEYISYLQRINDSIYNITGNYSYLTNRGKQYQSKSSPKKNSIFSNSSMQSNKNLVPATFKEKVEEFNRKLNASNNSISTSEVLIDNGSFIREDFNKNDSNLRYADSANRLKEMAINYSKKKINEEIEIDIDIEKEDNNMTNNSKTPKNQNKSKFKK